MKDRHKRRTRNKRSRKVIRDLLHRTDHDSAEERQEVLDNRRVGGVGRNSGTVKRAPSFYRV